LPNGSNLVALENLANAGQLKRELTDALEIERLLAMARRRLADARIDGQSLEGGFLVAYHLAHAASLAALRQFG
jgi:hypothetical protein